MHELEHRIAALEKKNRSLTRGLSAAFVVSLFATVGWINQAAPAEIRAKAFTVVNDSGKVVASITSNKQGAGILTMFTKGGVHTVWLESTNDGAHLLLSTNIESDAGESAISLGANAKQAYALVGSQGAARVELIGGARSKPSIAVKQGAKSLFRAPQPRK